MRTADEIIAFAAKACGTFGFAAASVRSALILWPHGWHLSSCVVAGAVALICIIWGWYK